MKYSERDKTHLLFPQAVRVFTVVDYFIIFLPVMHMVILGIVSFSILVVSSAGIYSPGICIFTCAYKYVCESWKYNIILLLYGC